MNFFVSNEARLAYRSDGPEDAPALVLVNSLGTDLRMWDPQIARLSQSLRVIRYDTRGHGASDAPPGPYTLEQLGELDEATPPALARDLHAAIVGSEIVVFPKVAHLSNIEAPAEFSARVLTFLAQSSST